MDKNRLLQVLDYRRGRLLLTEQNDMFIELFGEKNLNRFRLQSSIVDLRQEKLEELSVLRKNVSNAFKVKLSIIDIVVGTSAGVLVGLGNALFKDFIPQKGPLQHKHGTTRTAVDYKIPKPSGYSGSVQDLHRQIGPGHDIFRFKEALELMSGKTSDFNLWGKTATQILGHPLTPGNMNIDQFMSLGGFNIPPDPKAELINHLIIDFFTKRSLPIPGTSYIADYSQETARIMLKMYDEGFNLKNAIGNSMAFALIQLIIHSYTFLFKAIPVSGFRFNNVDILRFTNLITEYKRLIKENEFHVMMIIAHGASFLVDTIITTSSKSYTGLFQLNFASLLAFGKHLLQYILQSTREYKRLIDASKNEALQLQDIDDAWFANFKANFIRVATEKHFLQLFDPLETEKIHDYVINTTKNIRDINRKKQLLLRELRD
jgi:hypothetical protein